MKNTADIFEKEKKGELLHCKPLHHFSAKIIRKLDFICATKIKT